MRVLKLALLSGAVCTVLVMGSRAPASATALIAGLSKGLAHATSSSVILVKRKRKRGSKSGSKAAATAAGAAAVLGILGAVANAQRKAVIDRCVADHGDVDTERGVWYDDRDREHAC